jgi:hypothetical protein
MLKEHVMKSQLSTCIYMMKGVYDFSLMRALSRSKDVQLEQCGFHEKLRSATVNEHKLSSDYINMFGLLDDMRKSIDKLSDTTTIAALSPLLSAEMLYSKATDPSYIWLTGNSVFPLVINDFTGDDDKHDLILDIVYTPIEAMFQTSLKSNIPLSENVKFSSYQDEDIQINADTVLAENPSKQRYEISSEPHKLVSTFTYSDVDKDIYSHTPVLYHRGGPKDCPDGKCTFYWSGQKENSSIKGMICGGIAIALNHADGYVVLKDNEMTATREVASKE